MSLRFWTRKSMKQIHLLNESMKIECYGKTSTALIDASDKVGDDTNLKVILDVIKVICNGNSEFFRCFHLGHIPITG